MCTALSSRVPHPTACCPFVNVFLDVKCVKRIMRLRFCCLGVLLLGPKGLLDVWQAVPLLHPQPAALTSNLPYDTSDCVGLFVRRVQHVRSRTLVKVQSRLWEAGGDAVSVPDGGLGRLVLLAWNAPCGFVTSVSLHLALWPRVLHSPLLFSVFLLFSFYFLRQVSLWVALAVRDEPASASRVLPGHSLALMCSVYGSGWL